MNECNCCGNPINCSLTRRPAQPAINLADKSVQRRLATQWGYSADRIAALEQANRMALDEFERMNHEDSIFAGEFEAYVATLRQALGEDG